MKTYVKSEFVTHFVNPIQHDAQTNQQQQQQQRRRQQQDETNNNNSSKQQFKQATIQHCIWPSS